MSFINKLKHYNDAGYVALWIQTFEEERVSKDIAKGMYRKPVGKDAGCKVYTWDSLNGLCGRSDDQVTVIKNTEEPLAMFTEIAKLTKNGSENIFILKDFHLQFSKPIKQIDYIRAFKNLTGPLKSSRSTILFISPKVQIPLEVSKEIQLMDYSLPNDLEIEARLNDIHNIVNAGKKGKDAWVISEEIREGAINSAKGMTDSEVENAFALAIVENRAFNDGFVKSVFGEKIQQIKKGGMLNHIDTNIDFNNVGGLDGIKDWVRTRKNAFTKEARAYGLPFPKGLGLAGIAGCGKTLISKAIANEFKFPLYQLDLGSLFSKYVGETEGNFIQMTKTVDSIGRCVILIDEIEKYLNSGATSGAGDSGTSSRSFGTLLSWLSDRNNPAFVIFTSNNHLALPVELIRKGRFDELFWIDLPDNAERKDVLNVVIKRYNRDPKKFDIEQLVLESNEFTGAEIDNAFKDAMFAAFSDGKEVDQTYFVKELKAVNPQAKINEAAIEAMRAKVEGRLRRAANPKLPSYMAEVRKVKVTPAS